MLKIRLIPVLIIRDGKVVQSVQFKHTNVIHWKPVTAIDFFDRWAADEIAVIDVSRDTSKRDLFYEVIDGISSKCFVPLTVGGWITSPDEAKKLLRLGADKVLINTQAFLTPELITQCARIFGNQCIVVSIDVFRHEDGHYEVFTDRGRNPTAADPVVWAKTAEGHGAGEIFLNCINNDGFRQGYDIQLLRAVTASVGIPVIAMGGVFDWQHLVDGVLQGGASAVAAANILHYTEHSTRKAKAVMRQAGLALRT